MMHEEIKVGAKYAVRRLHQLSIIHVEVKKIEPRVATFTGRAYWLYTCINLDSGKKVEIDSANKFATLLSSRTELKETK